MPEKKTKPAKEAMSLDEIRQRVQSAVRDQHADKRPDGTLSYGPWIRETYLDHVVVCHEDGEKSGKLFSIPYSIDAKGDVTLGDPVQVQIAYVPVAVTEAVIREAKSKAKNVFDVTIIRAGLSKNGTYYPADVLAAEATKKVFEGASVSAMRFGAEHLDHVDGVPKELLTLNVVGVLEGVHYADEELRARLRLHEGADFIAGLLKLSVDRVAEGQPAVVGLSIDAMAHVVTSVREGKEVPTVASFAPDPTVDVVSRPAAGGEIRRLAASLRKETAMPEKVNNTPPNGETSATAATAKESVTPVIDLAAEKKKLEESMREQREGFKREMEEIQAKHRCDLLLEKTLAECGLSEESRTQIRESFEGKVFDEKALTDKIEVFRKIEARHDPSGRIIAPDRAQIVRESRDKIDAALYHMFARNGWGTWRDPNTGERIEGVRESAEKARREAGVDPIWSLHAFLREALHVDLSDVLGDDKRRARLKESLTTSSWGEIFADAMNRALLAMYRNPEYGDWRKIVSVEPLQNFRTQHKIRMGGYGNLPVVAQGANYQALTSPGDEEQTYSPKKYGGTEDLTREMILNDDVGAIARIPGKLAFAAARTLYEYVFDQLTIAGQPTMGYDSVTLFHSGSHSNLGTTALAAAEVAVVWRAMAEYTELTSGKVFPVRPRFLLVPVELAATAMGIVKPLSEFAPGEATDQYFVRTMNLQVIVVHHWSNAKDHVYVADPAEVPGFVMGFVAGREEPVLSTNDNPNWGSMFERDAVTYKIRHEYGGTPVDHRAFYAEDVA